MNKKFYLTAAIPYVNAAPHLGHALEFLQGDVIKRYHQLSGDDTLYLSGSDENSLKNVQAAEAINITTQELCDQNTQAFKSLIKKLNVDIDVWQRGSDKKTHWPGVQELWQKCQKNGDIYKKKYSGLYCVGCEEFKLDKDLVEGKCPEHPNKSLETVEEENYFFKLSRYQDKLEKLIKTDQLKIVPKKRKNEALSFIAQGLQDFSISRSVERAHNWGITVPDDPTQVMYVWFDALTIYMTGIGWGWDLKNWRQYWPADLHIIGKGINRFHTIYWPAMLMSAGLDLPKSVLIHGYITTEGQKMSKSLGNVINPMDLLDRYGVDPVRYYLLKEIPTTDDGDFSQARFKEVYNADLANSLGNLVQRMATLCEKASLSGVKADQIDFEADVAGFVEKYQFHQALDLIQKYISDLDKQINLKKPWQKTETKKEFIQKTCRGILQIAADLKPFLPETANKIEKIFTANRITKPKKPLFPRLE